MTQREADGSSAGPTADLVVTPLIPRLQPVFEELGLNGYQARVLLALLQAGSATAIRLGELSGVPRTSVYPVLKELSAKRLATQVAGRSSSWVSPGVEEALERLRAEHRQRVESLDARLDAARQLLNEMVRPHVGSLPYIHVIHSATGSRQSFERALAATCDELLMFTRPPWSWPKEGAGNETVLGSLRRGVTAKALYLASDLTGRGSASSRAELEQYHSAGTEGRVVDELPMKLAVFDRQVALLALNDPLAPADSDFPTSLLVEHPGYAGLQAVAFDKLFADAIPYERFVTDQ